MSREHFKRGVLARCAGLGLSPAETLQLVKRAVALVETAASQSVKQATDPVSTVLGKLIDVGKWSIPLALGAPLVGGFGAGYGLGRMADVGEVDIEEAKAREKIDELRRLASEARHNRALKRLRARQQPTARPLF